MALATVIEVKGNVFIKDISGNITKLIVGDVIESGAIVFGADDNSSYKIQFAESGTEQLFTGIAPQLFDITMIASLSNVEDGTLHHSSANPFAQSILTPEELAALISGDDKKEDISDETTAGQVQVKDSESNGDTFANRTGAQTDVNSDLRKAKFFGVSHDYKQEDIFHTGDTERLGSISNRNQIITSPISPTAVTPNPHSVTPPPPPVTPPTSVTPPPPPVTPPTSVTPPPVTPPTSVTPPPVAPPPVTIIKIVAADEFGIPLKDGSGNYLSVNETSEGGHTYYVALAFNPGSTVFNDVTKLATQNGTVDFTFTNGTATTNDYTPQAGLTNIALGTKIDADALDDYIADNGEKFTVTISNYTPTSSSTYGAVTINGSEVTTTITDNSKPVNSTTPHNPNDITNHTTEANKEIVMIKLFAADENGAVIKVGGIYQLANIVDEVDGNKAKYIAYAFNDGETTFSDATKLSTQVGQMNVVFTDGTALGIEAKTLTNTDGSQDYNKTPQTIQIGQSFSTEIFKDLAADGGQTYTVKLLDNTYASYNGSSYESVNTDNIAVTTTIKERLFAKIEVVNVGDNVANEGGNLTYTITIVDENGTAINVTSDATVHLQYDGYSAKEATKTTDYTAQDTVTVANGTSVKTFTLPAIDDYFAEGTEQLKITIIKIDYTNNDYSIKPHTIENGADKIVSGADTSIGDKVEVLGTIKDNPATVKEIVGGTGEDVPGGTPTYGPEDTVYVKITNAPSTIEGGNLLHTITLVNSAGVAVTVPTGQTVTVTLTYTHLSTTGTGTFTEGDLSTIVKTVVITGGTDHTDFTNITKDDFTQEGDEVYTVTITNVAQSGAFENVAISATNSTTGTITDGVTLGTPTNATVDEDNFDMATNVTTIHDTKSLNIVAPNGDNAYSLLFNGTPSFTSDNASYTVLKSDGKTIEYVVSGNTTTAYAGTGRTVSDKVFVITLDKHTAGGGDDDYTYTQYKNIDHPTVNVDDNIVLTFGYKITDQGQTSSVQTFTVTVSDSLPSGTAQSVTLNEDGSKTIYISDESFAGGNITLNNLDGTGDKVVAKDSTINIIDNITDKNVVGVLTNNGNGTLTFNPTANFSGATAGFTYGVSDGDGDTATATIGISVNPIADTPDMNGTGTGLSQGTIKTTPQVKEDNDNNATIESGTAYTATVGLILPKIMDAIDRTAVNSNDDQPEKLGLITLKSSTGETISANGIDYVINGTGKTIFINDIVGYHHSGLAAGDADISLTQAQFEAIVVKFENENAVNPKFTVSVDEYEVDDSNVIDAAVTKASNSQAYEVDILAVTDNITLAWNTDTDSSSNDLGNFTANTFTFTTVNEGVAVIDLKSLLTKTSGLETDSHGDLDGSEHRSYTISGIPEGTVVTLGSNSATANALGVATVNFSNADNMLDDPTFTMTLNKEYSGTLHGTITLNVTDTDSDSTGTIATKTASVNFDMIINPIADQVTLKVAQAHGAEDAGRTHGNDAANNSSIDAPANGIELNINVISDDNKDIGPSTMNPKETYDITIDGVPDSGSLYVFDKSLNSGAGNWVLVNETSTSSGNIIIDATAVGTYKVTINDYQNDHLTKFIPAYNSDADYTFNVSAYSVDGTVDSSALTQTLQINVTVDGVADIPVNDTLATHTTSDDSSTARTFNLVTTEDTIGGTSIKGIFATPATLDSNDLSTANGGDNSETLTFKVSGLATGFGITGATFIGGSGTSRMWLVNKADLIADSVKLTTPEHYAGEVDFKVQFVTTEASGDSKTHTVKDVSVMVTPVAEAGAIVKNSDTQDEDVSKALDFGFTTPDTGNATSGQESLQSFSIDVTGLQAAGITLVSNGVDLTTGKTGHQNVTVTNGVLKAVTATLAQDSDADYSFNISYTYKDVAKDVAGHTYTDTKTVTNQAYNVTVNAITDDISLAMATTAGTNNSVNVADGHVTVTGNGTFTKTLTVTGLDTDGRGSADTDGSEIFTRVTVSGVPEGISVGGVHGTYAGDTGGGNYSGFWYVDVPNDAINPSGTYALEFNVDGNFGNSLPDYQITVTAYSEDAGNGVEQNDAKTFTLTIADGVTGPGPGTPATISQFYQDIDNDGTHDHAYVVSTATDTTITDANAYQGSVLREDTQFHLSDVVHVETDTTGTSSQAFSITLKDVPAGVKIEGMTLNANGFYTLSGSGDQTAIVAKLHSILITPILNQNTDGTDATTISNTDLAFNIELTTYAGGGAKNTALINFTGSVLPVTDAMNLTVVNDGTTPEDTAQTFSITLSEGVDGAKTSIVDGKVYVKLTESYSDTVGTDGTTGVLSYNGGVITATAVSGVTGITDGNYYVITSATNNQILNFSYLPAANRDGTITVDTYVKNIESESWTTYTPAELTSHKTFSFDVNAVTDGFTLSSATATGSEDGMTALGITLTSLDSSEKIASVSISGVPDGFLLYYGANAGSTSLANNLGDNGTTTVQMTYGVNESVVANLWNIPLTAGALPAYIGLKAPENWSGTVPTITVNSVDLDGNSSSAVLDVTIAPLVDSLTLNTTKTFGNEGADILLNLNANVTDLDGSETVKLELTGLGAGASFKADGVEIDAANISYAGDKYTISNIAAEDINALSFVQSAMNGNVSVSAYMVENNGGVPITSAVVAGTDFNVNIAAVIPTSGADRLLYTGSAIDGGTGIDTVIFKNTASIDLSGVNILTNIEKLDMTGNGNQTLSGLTLDSIFAMTDSNHTLTIDGNTGDTVGVVDKAGWTKSAEATSGGHINYSYTKGTDTVTVKIDTDHLANSTNLH